LGDENSWQNSLDSDTYSIVDEGNVVLGMGEERLAKFPRCPHSDWHGYPVSNVIIATSLIDQWLAAGIIKDRIRRKLEKGEL